MGNVFARHKFFCAATLSYARHIRALRDAAAPTVRLYLLFDATIVIGMASAAAVALWLAEFALLASRARREERMLAETDAEYQTYAADVPYRFYPSCYEDR